jgi:hypothetical protein
MAGIGHLPAYDATAIIGGRVGRSLQGYGGITPILAPGGDKVAGDLYGLRPEESLRQKQIGPLGGGLIPRADFGLKTPRNLLGAAIHGASFGCATSTLRRFVSCLSSPRRPK